MPAVSIRNPILEGFNPDPSICRVGEDYYIAVSTFEWYPGVRIYHSRDLANWRLVATPLDRAELLDMRGEPDSCGVWAPCLSFADDRFWLCYTDVKRFDGNFKDTHNYLTTCERIDGDWSGPVHLNSSGFDPSLFHDDDGRKWYTNMVWDHRGGQTFFRGIDLQEFDPSGERLIDTPKRIFPGTELDYTEAPHLYRFGDWYYLITAEGGTGEGHAVTIARSRTVDGDYEADPAGPLLTTREEPDWPLQRNGHADIVETSDGELLLVHLCGRPLPESRRCPLGRETAIQRLTLTSDGWFRLAHGGTKPALDFSIPSGAPRNEPATTEHDDFDSASLDPMWQWLRTPYPETFMSLTARPGHLRLTGRESPGSLYEQALVARRQTDFVYEATTCVEFEPRCFQQLAGLMCYYNSTKFHYLYLSSNERVGKHIGIMSCLADASLAVTYATDVQPISAEAGEPIWLRASVDHAELVFSWSADGEVWTPLGPVLDHSLLSDEAGADGQVQFTGAFVGVACHDLTGEGQHADFDFLRYRRAP